jgi:hypothetical protein
MNKFAQSLILALVFAAPLAIAAPAVHAQTPVAVRHTRVKSVKTTHHKYVRHHRRHATVKAHK